MTANDTTSAGIKVVTSSSKDHKYLGCFLSTKKIWNIPWKKEFINTGYDHLNRFFKKISFI